MKYLYANWKSHKNITQAGVWMSTFMKAIPDKVTKALENGDLEICIFPPVSLLYPLSKSVEGHKGLLIGAQDVSEYSEGSHTGYTAAKSLEGIAKRIIIGHSERRKMGDTNSIVYEKFCRVQEQSIIPVLCLQNILEYIEEATILAYEPEYAIGTGNIASTEDIADFKSKLNLRDNQIFLYGGSANSSTIIPIINANICDGFLVGGASLDPLEFLDIANRILV